ncbi:MAG: DUF2334 domain-containing protein [Candidatus Micrarchaeota archaeon]
MLEWLVERVPNISTHLFNASALAFAAFVLICAGAVFRSRHEVILKKLRETDARGFLMKAFAGMLIFQAAIWLAMLQIDSETRAVPEKKLVIIELDDFWSLEGGNFDGNGYSVESYESVIRIIEAHNYSATLGVVPYIFIENNTDILALRDDSEMVAYLREKKAAGHEIAMHGYAHCRNRYYCPDVEENYLNILEGKKEIDKLFSQETVTYLPPGNFWDDYQYNNVKRNRFKIIGNTRIERPYWDGNVLITPRGYDVVEKWDWYGGDNRHSPYSEWAEAYNSSDFFILQLHPNTFDSQEKLDDLERFLDFLERENATVVTYFEAYGLTDGRD